MSELTDAIERDRIAECVDPRCHQTSADRRTLAVELDRLDEAVRVVMDGFYDALHTHHLDTESTCLACIYINLNKALLPGWEPREPGPASSTVMYADPQNANNENDAT